MAGFYHVGIKGRQALVTRQQVEKVLNLANDWYRYNLNTWIIYTNQNADVWYARLEQFAKPEGRLFICRLDLSDRQGWMEKSFWDWLKKNLAKEAQ